MCRRHEFIFDFQLYWHTNWSISVHAELRPLDVSHVGSARRLPAAMSKFCSVLDGSTASMLSSQFARAPLASFLIADERAIRLRLAFLRRCPRRGANAVPLTVS
jgi:hypothetical protein